MNWLATYFKLMDAVAPGLAAKKAYSFMSNPRVRKLRDFEEDALAHSAKETIRFKNFDIQKYSWGDPNDKLIFLIHGWEGQAGNFGAIIDLLLQKGYYVMAFDGPSHGHSSKASTSMFEYSEFISLMLDKYQPKAIISHSFGSVTTIFSLVDLPEVKVDQWFAVTTPFNFKDRINQIKLALGFSDRTVTRLINLIESSTNYHVDDLNMAAIGPRLKNVNEVIIIHSEGDKVIPISDAKRAHEAISQSSIIELEKLGHYGILWSSDLKSILKEKLN